MMAKPEIVAAMELLLSKQQIARIQSHTFSGNNRVAVLRAALNVGLNKMDLERWDAAEKERRFG